MTKLGDVLEKIVGGGTPSKAKQEYWDGGIPWATVKDMADGKYTLDDTKDHISQLGLKNSSSNLIPAGTVITSTRMGLGRVFVPSRDMAINQDLKALFPNTKIDNDYLMWTIANSSKELEALGSGTTVKGIRLELLRDLKIYLPTLGSQKIAAGFLGAYNDLIENNFKRIEKLESMARLLYDHYFKVPEATDWEQKSIAEILSGHIGGGWGSDNHGDSFSDPAYVIRGTDIPPARTGDISGVPSRFHKSSNLNSRKLIPGDIIFEVSGGSKGQPLGRSLLITEKLLAVFNEDVMCASFCKRVTPNQDIIAPEILYLSFLEAYENGEIDTYSVQSTGISNFKWSEYIERVTRSIPPLELQQDFQDKVVPIFRQINVLGIRNTNLRKTRDLLLPKLMSGEIRV